VEAKKEIKPSILALACLGIVLVTVLAFSNSLKNDFVWDDKSFITESPSLRSFSHVREAFTHNIGYSGGARNNLYRPVFELANMADYVIGGGKPFLFHVTNIILQSACAVLVFIFIYLIYRNVLISLATALFFAIHPIQTESVTYISGRADPLYAVFALLTLIFFSLYAKSKKSGLFYFISLATLSLSLLSKEVAIITPFLVGLYAFTMFDRQERKERRVTLALAGYFLVAAGYAALRMTLLDFSKTAITTLEVATPPLYIRTLTAAKAVFLYFRFLFFPVGFQMEVYLPDARSIMESSVFFSILGVLAILGALFYLWKRNKTLFFGMAWYFLCLVPILDIFPVNAKAAVHWLYLPSVGFFFALSVLLWDILKKNEKAFISIVLAISILLGCLTFAKNREWKNEEALYLHILPHSQTPRVYINLGNISARKNDLDKAVYYYLMALKIAPGQTEGYVNLGYIYNAKKQYPEAEAVLKKALEISPKHANAHLNLAVVYANTGKYDQALAQAQMSIESYPNQPLAYNIIGEVLLRLGRREEAMAVFKHSLAIDPNQPQIQKLIQ
jgi:Flp pilus assembly protein TadD